MLAQLDFDPDPERPVARAELRRASAGRDRQGAAAAVPRLHPRRADGGAREARDRAAVLGARAHEGAGHRHRLHLPPPRRGGGDRRPLHGAARRTRRGGEQARRLRGRRSRGGDDRASDRGGRRRAGGGGRGVAGGEPDGAYRLRLRAGEVIGLAGPARQRHRSRCSAACSAPPGRPCVEVARRPRAGCGIPPTPSPPASAWCRASACSAW